jgi:hypothetical protein
MADHVCRLPREWPLYEDGSSDPWPCPECGKRWCVELTEPTDPAPRAAFLEDGGVTYSSNARWVELCDFNF